MIFIKTHKDFNIKEIPINKENYNEFSIISRETLSNDYPVNVIYDNDNFLNKWSNLYGDMTYHYYVYKHIDEYDDIIGFIQYRRYFDRYVLNNYKKILNDHDVILPGSINFDDIIYQYDMNHPPGFLKNIIDLIHEYKPSYEINLKCIIPHNMFIMKKKDYIEYCKFMFWCFEILNIKYNMYKTYNDDINYLRIFSFIGERISTFFYLNHFDHNRIY